MPPLLPLCNVINGINCLNGLYRLRFWGMGLCPMVTAPAFRFHCILSRSRRVGPCRGRGLGVPGYHFRRLDQLFASLPALLLGVCKMWAVRDWHVDTHARRHAERAARARRHVDICMPWTRRHVVRVPGHAYASARARAARSACECMRASANPSLPTSFLSCKGLPLAGWRCVARRPAGGGAALYLSLGNIGTGGDI